MPSESTKTSRDRTAAGLAGVLFLNAIVFLFVGEALYRPFLNPLDLDGIVDHRAVFLTGVLLEWIASVPLILLIPVLLFPIFARFSQRAALAYLALRLVEVTLLTIADVKKLGMLDLATWADQTKAETIAVARLTDAAWIDSAGLIYNLVFGTSALVLFGTLLAARLVPAILAAWGLFASVVLMIGAVAYGYGLVPDTLGPVIWVPIALAEVALALWLIIKGVNQPR